MMVVGDAAEAVVTLTVMEAVMTLATTAMTDAEFTTATVVMKMTAEFTTFTYRLSNDRCNINGSSSENECNGKFDLNHFRVMKCGREFSDQRKSCVERSGGMRPAEESGIMGAKLLYRSMRHTFKEPWVASGVRS
jgi:transposase-like protein